ncbi:MAG: TonB-dependent receptor [Sphingomonas sp.]|jgi:outer membrane receptor protein involved in Fe transport|uniref:TonB-dependent receptor domain-containing protein n=1 Tax=Sphingomonas sp. TaxID=28214 RepID=UPI003564B012
MRLGKYLAATACTSVMLVAAPLAAAQANDARDYDLPAQELGAALRQVAAVSGRQVIVATELVTDLRAPALKGRFSAEDAVEQVLRGSGLRAVLVGGALVVQRDRVVGSSGDTPDGDILVTGTRIRGKGPVGSAVITIDRKAIDASGFATTQQIAQSIPQNFGGGPNEATAGSGTLSQEASLNGARGSGLNLRGLGASSTLILLNGDRPPLGGFAGAFSDLSMIPASAIERIEIVADGASAIYGSDAVAGVVNIVPRLDFKGAESSFRIGTADGDSQEYQASQLLGTRWSGGHAVIAYEYYQRDRLRAADRDFATDDLRRFGGPDYRGGYASPGTIYAGGQSFAIPRGQNGVGLTAAALTPGTVNRGDSWAGVDILPRQRRHSLFAAVSQDLGGGLRFYAHGLLSIRDFDQAVRPSADTRRIVSVTNPFYVDPIGTGQPVAVQYSFVRDLGNERARGRASAYGGTAGIEASLGKWVIDGHGTWGRQIEHSDLINRINTARLAVALADTNPATAYNLFGDGPSTNRATIDRVRGSTLSANSGTVWSATVRADGPLFSLPAGAVRLAIGGEYREERYRDHGTITDTSSLTPRVAAPIALGDGRRVAAGYAELLVPLFGGSATLPGFHRLDLSAAVRTEHYSDVGATTNPKFGIAWEPVAGLTFRGSYGKSFRAPSSQDLRQDPGSQLIFSYTIPDPSAAGGQSNVIVLRGNDPKLRPERATTWTLGADLKPLALPGLHASLTWFNIDYRDRIASPAAQLFNFLVNRDTYAGIIESNPTAARVAELYGSPIFVNFLNIPQNAAFAAVVDARQQNLSVVRQSGLDIDLGYGFGMAGGRAEIGAAGTYIFHIDQALTATAPTTNVVGILGNPVDFRARGRLSWTSDSFAAGLFANYVDSYVNNTNATSQKVASWTTFDVQLSYRFRQQSGALKGLHVALNANNLFDRDPPYAAYYIGLFTSGYDPENASPLGRVVSLQVTKAW